MRSIEVRDQTIRLERLDMTVYPTVLSSDDVSRAKNGNSLFKGELGIGNATPRRTPAIEDDHIDITIVRE